MRPDLKPKFKLWLSTDDSEGVFGDGKCRLLEAVGACGSLRLASERLGISYRKAWGDLKKSENILGIRLVEKKRGGRSGGGTMLTEAGVRWIAAYGTFRCELESRARDAFDGMMSGLYDPEAGPAGGE